VGPEFRVDTNRPVSDGALGRLALQVRAGSG
jgi:hypothetical protein